MNADLDLSGETVLLTGAPGIQGSRYARALARRGARVALLDRNVQAVHSLAAEINRERGSVALAVAADVETRNSPLAAACASRPNSACRRC